MKKSSLWMGLVLSSGLLWSALSSAAPAPDTLTLQAAIESARGNSPGLKKSELLAEASRWGKFEALADHLPHLDIKGTHFLKAKYSKLNVLFGGSAIEMPSAFPQSEFAIEASLLLFDGLGSINRYRAAAYEAEAATLELSHAKFKLEQQVEVNFYQALGTQELAKVAVQNIETLEQHLRLARASQRAGFSTGVDVLRLESQMEEAHAEKLLADDNVIISKNALIETMGVAQDDRPLDGVLPSPSRGRIPADLTFDVSQREDLAAQTRREESQDRLRAAAGAFWFPRVSFFGAEQFYKFGNFDTAVLPNDSFQNSYSIGLRLNWNLFDGGAAIAKQKRAAANAQVANEISRALLIAAPSEFEALKRRYIYNAALYEARKRSVEKSTESVRLATAAVRAGAKTHSEALDAELELFRARAGVIRAQLDAVDALARLELAVGHRL